MGDIQELTDFERIIYRVDEKGNHVLRSRKWKPIIEKISGKNNVIGYIRSSGGFTEMVDREGKTVLIDEIGIEPSLISPVDLIGPGIITKAFRLAVG